MNGIAANWQLDFTLRLFESVLDKRNVGFFDSSSAKRFCKSRVGEVVFGGAHYRILFLIGVLLFAVTFLTNMVADVVLNGLKARIEGKR